MSLAFAKGVSLTTLLCASCLPGRGQDNPIPRSTTVTVQDFKIELKRCEKISSKTISCRFVVTNEKKDRPIAVLVRSNPKSYFVDSGGMEVTAHRGKIGSHDADGAGTDAVTDVPIAGSLDFEVGDPKATSIAKLSIGLREGNSEFRAEFRKIPLQAQ